MNKEERDKHYREVARLFKLPPMYISLYNLSKRIVIDNTVIEYRCNYCYVCKDSHLIILN